ncbi:MAG: LysM peptidoglycan-binding domain-containing protein, partial [Oscillospiraceae bacterium]|nr:LysM peptidoglycan-binding domain-containing protein [Oscillospiraceae bacterium]
ALIILGLVIAISFLLGRASLSHRQVEYKTIYVMSGETLWGIASELQQTNDYYRGKDVRAIIDDLVSVNNLETTTLAVNQPLQIPTF